MIDKSFDLNYAPRLVIIIPAPPSLLHMGLPLSGGAYVNKLTPIPTYFFQNFEGCDEKIKLSIGPHNLFTQVPLCDCY